MIYITVTFPWFPPDRFSRSVMDNEVLFEGDLLGETLSAGYTSKRSFSSVDAFMIT